MSAPLSTSAILKHLLAPLTNTPTDDEHVYPKMYTVITYLSGIKLKPYVFCICRRQLRDYGCSVHIIEPGFHKTNIASPANISAGFNATWDRLSPELREEYGQEYFDKCMYSKQIIYGCVKIFDKGLFLELGLHTVHLISAWLWGNCTPVVGIER